ncbi:glycosyl hydrolase family 28-related protein [Burkholderia sp. LMG 13014]|uniref:glycosyl hydrolase family 28-related protein n=1 Tax=Burkholderia sp. LMG 13014 TaxID=2709306 RepID=UPI001962758D|nr:glycosyl hydrolase family 28-related protein [Burkholderia sp. LMG 13014]
MKIFRTRLRAIAGSLVAAAMSVPACAQFVPGQVLSATQLNTALQNAVIQSGAINGATIGNSRPSSGAFTSLAASTSNPSLLFNLGGVGASDRALQAILQEQKISVLAFGADPTGTRPSATAIQNAVNFACASPSQKTVYEPPGTFLWDHGVTINCPAVKLIGAGGGGYNDNSPNINATTINRWVGPQGGTALTITPSSDQKTEDNSVMGIFWDGNNSRGGIAVNLISARYGTYDIRAAHWATAFVQTDISPAATENSDVTGNIFYNISGYQTLPTDGSVLITNSAYNHNACWNHFFLIQAVYFNSPGVVLNGDDSERFDVINLYNADNGTAKGLVLNGSNTSPYANTRHNTFYLVGTGGSQNGNQGGVYSQGLDASGNPLAYPAVGNNIVWYDAENSQAMPTVDPGSSLWWSEDNAPAGMRQFYYTSSPVGYVQVDNSGKITQAGQITIPAGATSGSFTLPIYQGNTAAGFPHGVVSVQATPTTAAASFSASATNTAVTINSSSSSSAATFNFKVEGY